MRLLFLLWLLTPVAAVAEVRVSDALGHELVLEQPARRVVALAPHVTELLFATGAGAEVVGVVQYSDYPEAARALPRVGGYKRMDLEALLALKPDLVVAWKSGNPAAQVEKLAALGVPVYYTDPFELDDVALELERLGRITGHAAEGEAAAARFRAQVEALRTRYADEPPVRLFYQIWDRPLMSINGRHLISKVVGLCGGENVFAGLGDLAPTVSEEAVLAENPEAVIASGMGESRPEWLDMWKRWPQLAATARGNLFFIPPDIIQRHTPRVVEGARRLCEQLDQARKRRAAASGLEPK